MITARVDTKQLEEKLRRAAQASGPARQQALRIMLDRVMRTVDEIAPRDTNAFANAWAKAANSVGLGPFAILPLNRANRRGAARLGDWLRSAVGYWGKIVALNESRGRTKGTWPAAARAKLEQAKVALVDFERRNPNVIAMEVPPGKVARGSISFLPAEGHGQEQQAADRTYFRMTNQRRGARFIENRSRTMQQARAPFRSIGLTGAGGKRFIDRVAFASGLASPLKPRTKS